MAGGVGTVASFSGYRIHHNLLVDNRVAMAVRTGSDPASRQLSRVDHNCVHGGLWGITTGSPGMDNVLINARIDHNTTTQLTERAIEVQGDVEDVTVDHNISKLDFITVLFSGTRHSRFVDNQVHSARRRGGDWHVRTQRGP